MQKSIVQKKKKSTILNIKKGMSKYCSIPTVVHFNHAQFDLVGDGLTATTNLSQCWNLVFFRLTFFPIIYSTPLNLASSIYFCSLSISGSGAELTGSGGSTWTGNSSGNGNSHKKMKLGKTSHNSSKNKAKGRGRPKKRKWRPSFTKGALKNDVTQIWPCTSPVTFC